ALAARDAGDAVGRERAPDAAQRVALAKRCAAEPGPRLLATRRNRGPGSAKQRFAKSYALHRARDTSSLVLAARNRDRGFGLGAVAHHVEAAVAQFHIVAAENPHPLDAARYTPRCIVDRHGED